MKKTKEKPEASKNTKTPNIRLAKLEDVQDLLAYYKALLAEKLPTLTAVNSNPTLETEKGFIKKHLQDGSGLFLAFIEDSLVGVLSATKQDSNEVGIGISVSKEYRNQGIGSELIAYLFQWTPSHQVNKIRLEVLKVNNNAKRLYERFGFGIDKTTKDSIHMSRDV